MRRSLPFAGLLCAVALAGPAPALAVEEGVTIDPGSPSAKEYALPLESARRDANGDQDAPVKPGERDSELFGAGVTPAATSAPRPDEGRAPSPATPPKPAAKPVSKPTTKPAATPAAAASGTARAPLSRAEVDLGSTVAQKGTSSTLALIGGGGGVLLLVVLGGFALRATRGPYH